jgi:effector-binding domain-containing protein
MTTAPRFEIRPAQHYAAIRIQTTRKNLATEAPRLLEKVSRWLQSNRVAPGGPPLIRYFTIGADEMVDVEIGIATAEPVDGDRTVRGNTLPRGKYLTAVHCGPYEKIVDTTAEFLDWAREQGVDFDKQDGPTGTAWRARVEHYLTDPAEQPDPQKWETKLAFLVRHHEPRSGEGSVVG